MEGGTWERGRDGKLVDLVGVDVSLACKMPDILADAIVLLQFQRWRRIGFSSNRKINFDPRSKRLDLGCNKSERNDCAGIASR